MNEHGRLSWRRLMSLAELVKVHARAIDLVYTKLGFYDSVGYVVKFDGPEFQAELAKSGHNHPEVAHCKCIRDWREGK